MGNNNLVNAGMTQDTTNFMEGSASAWSSVWGNMYRNDINLSSGFPCKSGESNLSFSIGGWIRPTTVPTSSGVDIMQKVNAYTLYITGDDLQFWRYWADGSARTASLNSAFVDDAWSHVTATYDDSTKDWALYSYVGGSLITNSGTFDNNGQASTGLFRVGSYSAFPPIDYNMDEIFVFNRVLSQAEILKIINGTFGSVTTGRRRCVIA